MVPLRKKIWKVELITWVLDLLYPPKCPFCRRILENPRDAVCPTCEGELPWLSGDEGVCKVDFTQGCVSPLRYEDAVRETIHRYKFSPTPAYGQPLGQIMAQCIREHPEIQPDMVTWTPLSPKRRRERGFDQAELLACSLGADLGLSVRSTLKKIRHTKQQSSLEESGQRRANAKGAYEIHPKADVAGKNILLVDDVVTSGATLEECAAILRIAGADRVWCVTLAQVRKKDGKNS